MGKFARRAMLKGVAASAVATIISRPVWAASEKGPTQPSEIDVDKARSEGDIVLYTSLDTKIVDAISASFRKKYGIGVTYFRGGSADLTSKVLAESDAGRLQADVVDASDLAAILVMKDRGTRCRFRACVIRTKSLGIPFCVSCARYRITRTISATKSMFASPSRPTMAWSLS